MSLTAVFSLAIALAMDAFAVSVAVGFSGLARGWRAGWRLSFHFGLFQFLMPIAGWWAGSRFAERLAAVDHWIALALLGWIGTRMIREGRRELRGEPAGPVGVTDPSRGRHLLALSVATSIDALAAGLTLALIRVSVWYPAVVIGLVTWLLSAVGFAAGHRLDRRVGPVAALFGGTLLWLLGIRIVATHLAG